MRVVGTGRTQTAREPFPWFVLVLFGLAAIGLVATSAARILRLNVADTAREQRWRIEHEALIREATEYARVP